MADSNMVIEFLKEACQCDISGIVKSFERKEYDAMSFTIKDSKIIYRQSKITPTKTGQFVTLWKRDSAGITQPFDVKDDVDFIMIASQTEIDSGIFIFPKQVLLEQAIISNNSKGGKRGIRVYTPWDVAESKQAIKTQQWQTRYFYNLNDAANIAAIANIFS